MTVELVFLPRWSDDHGPIGHDKLRGFDVPGGDGEPAPLLAVVDPVRQTLALIVVVVTLLRPDGHK